MHIINFHLGAWIIGKFGHFAVSLEAPSDYGWAPAQPAKFNTPTYVESPHRVTIRRRTDPHKATHGVVLPYIVLWYVVTAGRQDNRGERYNRDFLVPSTLRILTSVRLSDDCSPFKIRIGCGPTGHSVAVSRATTTRKSGSVRFT
jgi:hypothetical protein